MELTGKKIGVAMSGSFCTYENAFQELQKLVEAGAKVQTIFQRRLRRLTAGLERQRSLCEERRF